MDILDQVKDLIALITLKIKHGQSPSENHSLNLSIRSRYEAIAAHPSFSDQAQGIQDFQFYWQRFGDTIDSWLVRDAENQGGRNIEKQRREMSTLFKDVFQAAGIEFDIENGKMIGKTPDAREFVAKLEARGAKR